MAGINVIVLPKWDESSEEQGVFYGELFTALTKENTNVSIVKSRERYLKTMQNLSTDNLALFLVDNGHTDEENKLINEGAKQFALSGVKDMQTFLGEDHDLLKAYEKLKEWAEGIEGASRRNKEV